MLQRLWNLDWNWLCSTALIIHILMYYTLNLILVFLSTAAWIGARNLVENGTCSVAGLSCGFTRWGLYFFLSLAASISSTTAGIMVLSSYFRPKDTFIDPLWVFRGISYTLLPLAAIAYIGWSNIAAFAAAPALHGLGGTFGLEMLHSLRITKPAFVLLHINLWVLSMQAIWSLACGICLRPCSVVINPSRHQFFKDGFSQGSFSQAIGMMVSGPSMALMKGAFWA